MIIIRISLDRSKSIYCTINIISFLGVVYCACSGWAIEIFFLLIFYWFALGMRKTVVDRGMMRCGCMGRCGAPGGFSNKRRLFSSLFSSLIILKSCFATIPTFLYLRHTSLMFPVGSK